MSKTVGRILQVATVIVAVAAAIPTGGTSLLAVGAAGIGTSAAVIAGAIAAATLVNSLILAGQQGEINQQRQASITQVQIGEGPRVAIFGKAAVAGTLADSFNYGGTYGTDWEVLVLALADHRCDALEGFYVNDTYVTFAGDGAVAGYNGQLEIYFRDGRETQTPPAVLTTYGGWVSADQLRGVSYLVAAYKADAPNATSPVWTGRPQFLPVLRGLRCYDPRKDSTVPGGSGFHRRDDPDTWEWSENAEICRYNFGMGVYACDRVVDPTMLLLGRGLTAAEAPPERIFAAANLCDEDVPITGGSEKRYRVGGVIAANESFGDVEDAFAAAMGGIVIQPEGGVAVEPGQAKAPVATITDADIISGTRVSYSRYRSEADKEWVNAVAARYVEPTQKWSDHAAPVRQFTPDIVADKGRREATPSLRLVTSGTQAQRIAVILRRMGRLWRTASLTLGPRFAEIEEGDWIEWTSARRMGGATITFRVESYALGRDWRMALTLREIEPWVYEDIDQVYDTAVAEQQDPVTAPYYAPGAQTFIVREPVWPLTSDDDSITIAAFNGTLPDYTSADYPAGTITGLAESTKYGVFLRKATGAYFAEAFPSLAAFADPGNIWIYNQSTTDAEGNYAEDDTPPGGYGGGGGSWLTSI